MVLAEEEEGEDGGVQLQPTMILETVAAIIGEAYQLRSLILARGTSAASHRTRRLDGAHIPRRCFTFLTDTTASVVICI